MKMMNNWYECTIKADKIDNEGNIINSQSKFLIKSISYSDVENRISNFKGNELPENLLVLNIKQALYEDIIIKPNPNYWFKAKVIFLDINEKTGKPQKKSKSFLVPGDNFFEAIKTLQEYIQSHYLIDSYIHSFILTNITDVIQ